MPTAVLTLLRNAALILAAAACLPGAAACFIRACIPLATAIAQLRASLTHNPGTPNSPSAHPDSDR